jgi:plastocyanin
MTVTLAAAASMLLAAACSGTTASSPPASAAGSAPAAGGTVQDLAVEGQDFAFVAPASIPAGLTKITLTNTGQEEHQAQVARIAEDKTFEDLTGALQSDETGVAALAMLTLSGGPTGVQPGAAGSTTANLAPGTFVFLCFVSSDDGIPHLAKGMIAPLEVTEPAVEAEVPAGDAALTLQDFAFVGLDSLSAGPHTVTVTNSGPQPHEATIVQLAEGVAATDLISMFTSTEAPSGPPPFTTAGGVAGIAAGETVSMDVDLPAGEYAFICFVPDPASGAPHAALGMIGGLTIQ